MLYRVMSQLYNVAVMRKAFTLNDVNKTGFIDTNRLAVILSTFGQVFDEDELNELIEEVDVEGEFRVVTCGEIIKNNTVLVFYFFIVSHTDSDRLYYQWCLQNNDKIQN